MSELYYIPGRRRVHAYLRKGFEFALEKARHLETSITIVLPTVDHAELPVWGELIGLEAASELRFKRSVVYRGVRLELISPSKVNFKRSPGLATSFLFVVWCGDHSLNRIEDLRNEHVQDTKGTRPARGPRLSPMLVIPPPEEGLQQERGWVERVSPQRLYC